MITQKSIQIYFWIKALVSKSLASIPNPHVRHAYVVITTLALALAVAAPVSAQEESTLESVGMRLLRVVIVFGIIATVVTVIMYVVGAKEARWGLLVVPIIFLGAIVLAFQIARDQIEGEQELGTGLWNLLIDVISGV